MPSAGAIVRLMFCVCAVGLLGASQAGCSRILSAQGVRLESFQEDAALIPSPVSRAYRAIDQASAEFYLSDIPLRILDDAETFEELEGTIVRVTLFLPPRPGKTPIESTASTATVQAAVLARGEVGIYGGGGFLLPSGRVGDRTFGGTIRDGSVRLLHATPGFVDRLGAARFQAGISAPEDQAGAAVMGHVFDQASRLARRRSAEP
jgi:hypothetical protein